MGLNLEIFNLNNNPQYLFICKENKIENVGSSLINFQIIQKLNNTIFSNVYLVKSLITNKFYYMKEMFGVNYENALQISNQVNFFFKNFLNIRHPNLVTYFSVFTEKGNIYYISNYIQNPLKNYFTQKKSEGYYINEKKIWGFLVQSLSGIFYLHGILKKYHGNLNLNSFLIDNDLILKITDYGIIGRNSSENIFQSEISELGNFFMNLIKDTSYYSYYSNELKNFLSKLINKQLQTNDAYNISVKIYINTYLKNSGIISCINCLLGIKNLSDYFINFNKPNINDKYKISYTLKNIFVLLKNNSPKFALANSIKLRLLLFDNKEENLTNFSEINIVKFLPIFLEKLHDELNKNNNSNDNYSSSGSNENEAVKSAISKFSNNFHSKISDMFIYLSKTTTFCGECNQIIRCTSEPRIVNAMFPKKASIYVNKQNITIYDLFYHYIQIRECFDNLYCPNCCKLINKIKRKSIWYTAPKIIVMILIYEKNDIFNLKIDEIIDITNYVEQKVVYNNKIKYYLRGAVFEKQNQDSVKYCGFRSGEKGWMKNDDKGNIYDCTFDNIIINPENNFRPLVLFYNILD